MPLEAAMMEVCKDSLRRIVFCGTIPMMRVLALSDQVPDRIYQLVTQGHFQGIDFLIGCGDLPYDYLEYMISILNLALFYVPGNHDPEYLPWSTGAQAEGGIYLDLKTTRIKGLLLAGFGGSVRYRPNAPNQYSQAAAYVRAATLMISLFRNRLRYGRFLDILITHSPPYGVHDEESEAHRGLKAINLLLHWAKPRYHLHGHMHYQQRNLDPDVTQRGRTTILNVHPYRCIEIPDAG